MGGFTGDDHLFGGPGIDRCHGGRGHDTATDCEVWEASREVAARRHRPLRSRPRRLAGAPVRVAGGGESGPRLVDCAPARLRQGARDRQAEAVPSRRAQAKARPQPARLSRAVRRCETAGVPLPRRPCCLATESESSASNEYLAHKRHRLRHRTARGEGRPSRSAASQRGIHRLAQEQGALPADPVDAADKPPAGSPLYRLAPARRRPGATASWRRRLRSAPEQWGMPRRALTATTMSFSPKPGPDGSRPGQAP